MTVLETIKMANLEVLSICNMVPSTLNAVVTSKSNLDVVYFSDP